MSRGIFQYCEAASATSSKGNPKKLLRVFLYGKRLATPPLPIPKGNVLKKCIKEAKVSIRPTIIVLIISGLNKNEPKIIKNINNTIITKNGGNLILV